MNSQMQTLPPKVAVMFASIAYKTLNKEDFASGALYQRLKDQFDFSENYLKGVSGSILERVFKHTTPFGCIAKGKRGPFGGDFVLALRGD